jgi:hypothetical protein
MDRQAVLATFDEQLRRYPERDAPIDKSSTTTA